jgi:hypothetical protein
MGKERGKEVGRSEEGWEERREEEAVRSSGGK